ncbi:MAG: hypothetical protein ACM359_22390 [Bacillota bacterium]
MIPPSTTGSPPHSRIPAAFPSAAGYRVIQADIERDREAILDVWRRNLAEYFTPGQENAKFAWYYQNNPYGSGRCWLLLKTPGDHVIGATGLGLRRISIAGTPQLVGLASDLAVDREHRTLLPALMLQRAALTSLQKDLAFIYGLPNPKATSVLHRVGYQSPGSLVRYAKVLNLERYLQNIGPLRLLARGAAAVLNPALRLASAETWRRPCNHNLCELPQFDDRFDDLWQRASSASPLIGHRTREFLRWRYTQCPLLQYRILALLDQHQDRLLGYLVCYNANPHELTIADILADGPQRTLDDLLAQSISFARTHRFHVVYCRLFGSPRMQELLARFGFRRRQAETPLVIALGRDGSPSLSADQIQQWHFLLGDEDCN